MRFQPLAPRPGGPVAAFVAGGGQGQLPVTQHDETEWAAMYPHIEHLYVRDRRKLREVIAHMEKEFRFKASEQMYKKRFARWGFHKNSRGAASAARRASSNNSNNLKSAATNTAAFAAGAKSPISLQRRKAGDAHRATPTKIDPVLRLSQADSLTALLITNVRNWTTSFLESMNSIQPPLEPSYAPSLGRLQERRLEAAGISSTFKLVPYLLERGHGVLAGRVARKAFLQVEEMLELEGPALVWNLVEMMYSLVTTRHEMLFTMLLNHLILLSHSRQLPPTHPMIVILCVLEKIVTDAADASNRHTAGSSGSSESTSPLPSLSSGSTSSALPSTPSTPREGDRKGRAASDQKGRTGLRKQTDTTLKLPVSLPGLLERAWVLNAELILNCVDVRMLLLYFRLMWDDCSLSLPGHALREAEQFVASVRSQHASIISAVIDASSSGDRPIAYHSPEDEHRLLQQLLSPRKDASPPRNFEHMRDSSIIELRAWQKAVGANSQDSLAAMRILAGVLKWQVIDGWPGPLQSTVPTTTTNGTNAMNAGSMGGQEPIIIVPRLHAHIVAYVIKTLVWLNLERGGEVGPAIEQMRAVLALHEYAQGEADWLVVKELWELQDLLIAAGEEDEAAKLAEEAYRRMETMVQDIPVDAL